MASILASDLSAIIDSAKSLATLQATPTGLPTVPAVGDKVLVTLWNNLQTSLNAIETDFSGNCCQSVNNDCCQSCQTSKNCTYTCQSCQTTASVCQSCQSSKCQSQCASNSCYSGYGTCTSCCSCFTANTKVALINEMGIFKTDILQIKPGDMVLGPNGTVNIVEGLFKTNLGNRRMLCFTDKSLTFSEEHMFWVRRKNVEGWGTHNYDVLMDELCSVEYESKQLDALKYGTYTPHKPFSAKYSILLIEEETEYSTLNGWTFKKIKDVSRKFTPNTVLYNLIVSGNHMFYANGYLVSGFATDEDFDYGKFKVSE